MMLGLTAEEHVQTRATEAHICARAALQGVDAGTAEEAVVSLAAGDRVKVRSSEDEVRSARSSHGTR